MIVSKADQNGLVLEGQLVDTSTSSFDPPPAFSAPETSTTDHLVIDFPNTYSPPGGEEPPPEFMPYEADYFQTSSGDVISHDDHLNEDGEALYRFLLSQATTPPSYRLHCRGTHQETHTHLVTKTDRHGRQKTEQETYHETIIDFDFYVDVGQHIVAGPVHWSIADSEPTYRGTPVREIELQDGRRGATKKEISDFAAWKKERSARGLPPWIGNEHGTSHPSEPTHVLKSSRTLREWADDYCASNKVLKEFVYEKVVHGWNIENMRNAIRTTISASLYQGHVQVDFELHSSKVCIRSNNKLSRILSNKWLKFLSFLLLVYPFIWLFERFHPRGGGRWEVCGGAYALKRWKPAELGHCLPNDCVEGVAPVLPLGTSMPRESRLIRTESGVVWLAGLREGEWFKGWEWTIRMAVQRRFRSKEPLLHPTDGPVHAAQRLDGYEP